MNRIRSIYCFLLTSVCLFQGCVDNPHKSLPHYLVIEDINIVDVINRRVIPHQTVVLKDSLIHFTGKSWDNPDKRSRYIQGKDRFLMPGLWDMHFHLCWDQRNDTLLFPLLLSNGITGIRDMGGDLGILNQIKSKLVGNPGFGPEIYGAGPIVDGNPPVVYDFSVAVDHETNIPLLLDSLFRGGADFIKTYSLLRASELSEIARYTSSRNRSFAGHLSEFIEPEMSIAMGQKSVEHLNRLEEIWQDDPLRLEGIAELMLQKGTWFCPTLIVYQLKAHMDDPEISKPDYDRYILPVLKEEWAFSKARRLNHQDTLSQVHQKELLNKQMALVDFLHKKGIPFLAGSDFGGMPYVYPGIGLHEELEYLVEAGLSPGEVLTTATINAAVFFSMENSYGSVTPGKFADLVILGGNPLENIKNTRQILAVFRKGRQIVLE